MAYYVVTNADGRIIGASMDTPLPTGMQIDPPEDFDFERPSNYRIVDGVVVYDPLPEPEAEVEAPDPIAELRKLVAEMGKIIAEQDNALVELAGMIAGGGE